MANEKAVITHPQTGYDNEGVIARGLSHLSGLEVLVLVNDWHQFENHPAYIAIKGLLANDGKSVVFSYDGRLKPEDAQEMVESYESISLFGGCLNSCLSRTYRSIVDAFRNSQKNQLRVKFFLDGAYDDFIPFGGVLNLSEILEEFVISGLEKGEALLFMVGSFLQYLEAGNDHKFNAQIYYNGKPIYENAIGSDKTVRIDVFDRLPNK